MKSPLCRIYILACEDEGFYISQTTGVTPPLNRHISGGVPATRYRGPFEVVFFQFVDVNTVETSIRAIRRLSRAALAHFFETTPPEDRTVARILGVVAKFERKLAHERARTALAKKPKNKRRGRPSIPLPRLKVGLKSIAEGSTLREASLISGVSRATLMRARRKSGASSAGQRPDNKKRV